MVRYLPLLLMPLWLGACSQWLTQSAGWQETAAPAGRYDFNWQLSGDPAVAPLQVFGDGQHIWLQFAPGQAFPALFAHTPQGERPVPYITRSPYLVVEGPWRTLVMRGGRLAARADHQGTRHDAPAPTPLPFAALPDSAALSSTPPATQAAAQASVPDTEGGSPMAQAAQSAPASPPAFYRASPADGTMRAVLARWASQSGWLFQPQHWAVDVDIPLAGTAEFPADFKTAVRELLAATELADRPVQPCFYVNQVLRVVPLTQACDRSAPRAGSLS